jgi:2-polyprenyl-3-methyl-5-hydroxy-6-metoxy-1,4-benzoquinol methylase
MKKIESIERISVDLMKLKPIEVQESVYKSYVEYLERFFKDGEEDYQYFEDVPCPVCSTHTEVVLFVADNFKYRKCKTCSSIYNSPCLKKTYLEQMYSEGEYENYVKKLTLPGEKIRKSLTEVRKYNQIASLFMSEGSILDVGCGAGVFLTIAAENGWDCTGIELSKAGGHAAMEHGVEILQSTFDEFYTNKKFDCITFWGVLEHVVNPMEFLEKAANLLEENGVIVFEVPSANSVLLDYVVNYKFVPFRLIENGRHLTFFSNDAIESIGKNINCELEYIESNGLDIQTILINEVNPTVVGKLLNLQKLLDEKMLSDHYRVFMRIKQ